MAARIELNAEQGFGGAFVIVPPGEDVKPHVLLMLNNSDSPAMFWASLQTTCQLALQELADQEQQAGAFGGMRR
jgi:hypothetical protein